MTASRDRRPRRERDELGHARLDLASARVLEAQWEERLGRLDAQRGPLEEESARRREWLARHSGDIARYRDLGRALAHALGVAMIDMARSAVAQSTDIVIVR
ncbi:MAG: hypothetical protein ACRDV9_05960 [Acidimicrobiia bacterium]